MTSRAPSSPWASPGTAPQGGPGPDAEHPASLPIDRATVFDQRRTLVESFVLDQTGFAREWRATVGYRRALDFDGADNLGQDALGWVVDTARHCAIAVVVDGVSRSYQPAVAARCVAHALLASLHRAAGDTPENIRLAVLRDLGSEELRRAVALAENEARLQSTLQTSSDFEGIDDDSAASGSEAVFVGVIFDFTTRRATLVGVGDAFVQFELQSGLCALWSGVNQQERASRWSSLRGLAGASLMIDQTPELAAIILHSDGLRHFRPADPLFTRRTELLAELELDAKVDDVSFFWLGRNSEEAERGFARTPAAPLAVWGAQVPVQSLAAEAPRAAALALPALPAPTSGVDRGAQTLPLVQMSPLPRPDRPSSARAIPGEETMLLPPPRRSRWKRMKLPLFAAAGVILVAVVGLTVYKMSTADGTPTPSEHADAGAPPRTTVPPSLTKSTGAPARAHAAPPGAAQAPTSTRLTGNSGRDAGTAPTDRPAPRAAAAASSASGNDRHRRRDRPQSAQTSPRDAPPHQPPNRPQQADLLREPVNVPSPPLPIPAPPGPP